MSFIQPAAARVRTLEVKLAVLIQERDAAKQARDGYYRCSKVFDIFSQGLNISVEQL